MTFDLDYAELFPSNISKFLLSSLLSVTTPTPTNFSHTQLDNVTLYCTKLKNPTRMAMMATALDLGIN